MTIGLVIKLEASFLKIRNRIFLELFYNYQNLHKLNQIFGEIVIGTKIKLSDANLEVVSVGPVANENFKNLGHLVLKLDSSNEEAQLGDVRCTFDNKPNIKIGDTLRINN